MIIMMPRDPAMLLSFVNMRLRDQYSSLDEFCEAENVNRKLLMERLAEVNYYYDEKTNQFK
ncbi:DUF4250 domain-containing protein [Bilifractor sp. LCP21S3_F8]|jgi:hypothetical protein|uniref:DUF4250 domain-containing protein n=2 Tax=Bilifractor TaxID=2815776 RepID=UPI003F903E1F